MAGSTVPSLTEKATAIGTDIIYITDGVNDYQITLTKIFNFINGNITGITEAQLSLADNVTNNSSTARHGFVPKLPNDSTKFYNGVGAYAVPPTGITNGAGNNVIPKSDGTNLVAIKIEDDNTNIFLIATIGEIRLGDWINDGNQQFILVDNTIDKSNLWSALGGHINLDTGNALIGINSTNGRIELNSFTSNTVIGDTNGINNNTVLEINDTNQLITSTKPIQVNDESIVLKDKNGNFILKHQRPAIADLSGVVVLLDVENKVNDILAMLRTHGLIAT